MYKLKICNVVKGRDIEQYLLGTDQKFTYIKPGNHQILHYTFQIHFYTIS